CCIAQRHGHALNRPRRAIERVPHPGMPTRIVRIPHPAQARGGHRTRDDKSKGRRRSMKEVIVIDQAVPKVVQDMLESIALGDKITWCRSGGATFGAGASQLFPVTANSVDAPQFTHLVFDTKQPVSQLFPILLPVITAIPYTIKQLI